MALHKALQASRKTLATAALKACDASARAQLLALLEQVRAGLEALDTQGDAGTGPGAG